MLTIHTGSAGWEYYPSDIALTIGKPLNLTEGKLAAISDGATAPEYVSMCDNAAPGGAVVPVIKVTPDIVFETTTSVAIPNVKIGDKVEITTDGKITATEGGCAEVIYIEDTTAGSTVRIRFA